MVVETIKELTVKFRRYHVLTLLDEHGDRWVTVPSVVACLGIDEFETTFPVELRLTCNEPVAVIPLGVVHAVFDEYAGKLALLLQQKVESEWLYFFGYIKGPLNEGGSRRANRESLHMLKKALALIGKLLEKQGFPLLVLDGPLHEELYKELIGILGYSQATDWEDLSQWELQNLTFVQNAYTSSILLYLSHEELHEAIPPQEALQTLMRNLKYDLSKTMNSMFMCHELSCKLGNISEFNEGY